MVEGGGWVNDTGAGDVLLTRDVADVPAVVVDRAGVTNRLVWSVYLVVGDDDVFFRRRLACRSAALVRLCAHLPRLCWIPQASVVVLTQTAGLVGKDRWCEERLGDLPTRACSATTTR